MAKEIRRICDYYRNGQWIFRLGYVRHLKAHAPLPLHTHADMTEFVYMQQGAQTYRIGNREYRVEQQEVFFTLPHELHDTGSVPEERSVLYYLIIDLPAAEKLHLFVSEDTDRSLTEQFADKDRVFPASSALPDAMKALLTCFDAKESDPFFDTHIRNALSDVLISLLIPQSLDKNAVSGDLSASLRYINAHPDEMISVSDLAAIEHLSRSAYHRHFMRTMGIPPGEYILRQRTEHAKELLCTTKQSVTEIAARLGFSSGQYFATVFRRYCSETPTQYRKKYKNQGEIL